ncbi:MAG: alpha/beta fold hydrolase, partial [Clostridia bacterium]
MVEFKNRHGHTLRGILTLPDNVNNPPIVINLHGFSGDKCGYKFSQVYLSREFMEVGVAMIRFDFFGSGESDGAFSDMTFTSECEDAVDIFNYVKTLSEIDSSRIYLQGHSMGGFVAGQVAPKLDIAGLILMCPGASMWYSCDDRINQFKAFNTDLFDIEGLQLSIKFYEDMKNCNPFEDAKGFKKKVLLIRGTEDKLVDDETCQKYIEIYDNVTFKQIVG